MEKVRSTIQIEIYEEGGFNVIEGDKCSEHLGYDEMLGLVSALTIAKEPKCLCWMRTKEEHDAQFNSLKKAAEDITDVEFEDILVPESIEIYQIDFKGNYGDRILIKFNDSQLLGYYVNNWIVNTYQSGDSRITKIQCKLIPCNRQDLKAGDTAFSSSLHNPLLTIDKLHGYSKVLDDGFVAHISSDKDGIIIRDYPNESWYKVVPV